ncbi:hypothetical protein IFM89_006253 [Coptis chinensis]|uniref:Uncharacterized protein n=1 Tax=Coptis chinensis TaxID=261450 RepID=A0A835IWF3_9MAGN|nr:hypothetical protein IFM89_006253 [Coptis chinensis]
MGVGYSLPPPLMSLLSISLTWCKSISLGFMRSVNSHYMFRPLLMSLESQKRNLKEDKPHGSPGELYNFRDPIMEDNPV